jgi:hypothetical protein
MSGCFSKVFFADETIRSSEHKVANSCASFKSVIINASEAKYVMDYCFSWEKLRLFSLAFGMPKRNKSEKKKKIYCCECQFW